MANNSKIMYVNMLGCVVGYKRIGRTECRLERRFLSFT
jgi:hypothetical protein